MAGHSKWAKIKHQKAIKDAKKGKSFSKFSQQIAVAARDGGGDLDANFTLRLLVEKAKAASMPSDNIQRAIDKGTGKAGDGSVLESIMYEGFGPAGISCMVLALTDNKNRTVSQLRKFFDTKGGNLGESGSVSWNFTQKGKIVLKAAKKEAAEKFGADDVIVPVDKDEVILELMEVSGVEDIRDYESVDEDYSGVYIELITDPKDLGAVRDQVHSTGYILDSSDLVWIAGTPKELSDEALEKAVGFIDDIEEMDDVQSCFTDIDHIVKA